MTCGCLDGQGERDCGEDGAGHPREWAVREPPLRRVSFALRKGRGCVARGLGTGLGKGVLYGFWVPACAGMTWLWGGNDGGLRGWTG